MPVKLEGPRPVTTDRLRLEPLVLEHARALDRFARLWEVSRYTANIPHPYPPRCAEDFARRSTLERRDGGGWVYAVIGEGEAGMIGVIDITLADDRRTGELGYAFAPWSWGKGYATEAARAMIRLGFGYMRLDRIEAYANVENPASCRVLAKAGLRRIGEQRMPAPARDGDMLCEAYRAYWSQVR